MFYSSNDRPSSLIDICRSQFVGITLTRRYLSQIMRLLKSKHFSKREEQNALVRVLSILYNSAIAIAG
ncbi:hypothetical protein [Microcoleus sp.]|uniref:hypothetical protein n=1 Tax=Microcoleus sp. TaxID=44472 RepID=UPI003525A197